jgi:ABC-type uncharacterized transport system permease subunit
MMASGARASLKAMAPKFGLMVVNTKVIGIKVSQSAKALKLTLMAQQKKVDGKAVHL